MDKEKPRKLNIVVVGRSGVGKSSFLNYAAGEKIFETGIGEPVTQKYFQEIDIEKKDKNITYCLFDTKGLEAGNTKEWKDAIFSEIDKRDTSSNIYDWFHTIIFCIDASSKRIQPFEIKAIQELSEKGSVLVLLTKKDMVSEKELEALKQQIISDIGRHVQVLSVCSVSSRTRRGVSQASGLEKVLQVSFFGLWEKAAKVLPNQAIKPLVSIKTNLRMGNKLSDALAYYTLKVPFQPNKNRNLSIFPTKDSLVFLFDGGRKEEIEKELSNIYDDKKIPPRFGIFSKISSVSEIPYRFSGNDLILTISSDAREFLNIPDVLSHNYLDDGYYRTSIITYINFLYTIINNLKDNLLYNNKTSSIVGGNRSVIKEVLSFYRDITGNEPRHIDDTKTKEACIKLEDSKFYEEFFAAFQYKKNSLINAIYVVGQCTFFSGEERREAEHEFHAFKDFINDFVNDLNDRIGNLQKYYSTELHAYGEYCIREDELSDNRIMGKSSNEENFGVNFLHSIIKEALSDGKITPKEYSMIKLVACQQGITDSSEIDNIILEVKNSIS